MADRFEDLRTFTTVISRGGINAAAADLGIAKSAVSRRISDLEKRLGVTLVERSTRRFEPTAVGLEYAARARAILTTLDELDASMTPNAGRRSLAVAAPSAIIAHVLLPAMGVAASMIERTSLRFLAIDAEDHEPAGDIVIGEEAKWPRASRPLFSTSLIICASPTYVSDRGVPDGPGAFDVHVSIAVGEASQTDWQLGDRKVRAPAVTIVTPDVEAAASAAVAGLGLVQLPDYVVADAISRGRLVAMLAAQQPPAIRMDAFYDDGAGLETRRVVDALAHALR